MVAPKEKNNNNNYDCTLAYIRALTRPFLYPPLVDELKDVLLMDWNNIRIPVDPNDYITQMHWKEQNHNALFHSLFQWEDVENVDPAGAHHSLPQQTKRPCASLHPYFSFGMTNCLFFSPWEDVANCLKHLVLHQIGCHQTHTSITLYSHDTELFIATAWNFDESVMDNRHLLRISPKHYLLRCHHDKRNKQLIFGYHTTTNNDNNGATTTTSPFQKLHVVSLEDENWRLTSCIILRNIARILNVLKDFAIPLACNEDKLRIVDDCYIQKTYKSETIGNICNATVDNMISIYAKIAIVPHTDKLIEVQELLQEDQEQHHHPIRVCKFAPIGRSYLPENLQELLDALICVCEALVELHEMGIMHRDIRWANVFHAFPKNDDNSNHHVTVDFSREWILFDFEFAAMSPQPAFGPRTLTPGNHAPEMISTLEHSADDMQHTTAVDIWGLGYLILHAEVDLPMSHASDLVQLQRDCMNKNPNERPDAKQCLQMLQTLQSRPVSTEKDIVLS